MADKMSTAKLVTRIVHMVFYLNWIVFINRPSRIFMVLDDNLAGQSVMCGCFKSLDRSFESPHPSLALVRLEFSLEFYIDEEFQSILSFCPKNH